MVIANLIAYAVHRVGDLVVRMARNVLVQRGCIHVASGAPLAQCESFCAFEDVIGNGYGSFHT